MIITKRGEKLGDIKDLATVKETAENFKAVDRDNKEVTLSDYKGELVLISVFPDINTSVCDMQTRHFFAEAVKYEGLVTLNVSNNTVGELNDWCATAGLDVVMLSDEGLDFANKYGLLIEDAGILARSIFLVDREGVLVYKEIVDEITNEPNYDAVFSKVKELL